jgi:hypothetical protein
MLLLFHLQLANVQNGLPAIFDETSAACEGMSYVPRDDVKHVAVCERRFVGVVSRGSDTSE